jgi:hypothetical protein
MSYSFFEATHQELNPAIGEYTRLEWTRENPQTGRKLSLGAERIWTVIAIDEYRLTEKTQPEFEAEASLFLNHCALEDTTLPERYQWKQVEIFQENPLAILQLFISPEQVLIQSSVHFYGKRVKIGENLRNYHHQRREMIPIPWRVSRIDSYQPQPEQNPYYCYAAVHIAHCIPVLIPQTFKESDTSTFSPVLQLNQ